MAYFRQACRSVDIITRTRVHKRPDSVLTSALYKLCRPTYLLTYLVKNRKRRASETRFVRLDETSLLMTLVDIAEQQQQQQPSVYL